MLSAVIRSRHSYGAMHLVVQPPDQRSVRFGPLVLETNLFKNQRLQQIKTNLSHACSRALLRASDCNFILRLLRIAQDVQRSVSTGAEIFLAALPL